MIVSSSESKQTTYFALVDLPRDTVRALSKSYTRSMQRAG